MQVSASSSTEHQKDIQDQDRYPHKLSSPLLLPWTLPRFVPSFQQPLHLLLHKLLLVTLLQPAAWPPQLLQPSSPPLSPQDAGIVGLEHVHNMAMHRMLSVLLGGQPDRDTLDQEDSSRTHL
jgi:hypothetical protein